jgi:hypothetical protein
LTASSRPAACVHPALVAHRTTLTSSQMDTFDREKAKYEAKHRAEKQIASDDW